MKHLNNSRGDTIVEVLLAIIVVGSILSGVYLLARTSLVADRQSQERSEGLKIAEAQVEALRGLALQPNAAVFDPNRTPNIFCLDSTATVRSIYPAPLAAGKMTILSSDKASNYTSGATGCTQQDAVGNTDINFNLSIDPCGPNDSSPVVTYPDCYNVVGSSPPALPGGYTGYYLFIVRARWDSVKSQGGREEVQLVYRIYPSGLRSIAALPPGVGGGGGGGGGGPGTNGLGNPNVHPVPPNENAFVTVYNDYQKGYPLGRIPISCYIDWGDTTTTTLTPTQCRSYDCTTNPVPNPCPPVGVYVGHSYCDASTPWPAGPPFAPPSPDGVPCGQTIPRPCPPGPGNGPTENVPYPTNKSYTIKLYITDASGSFTPIPFPTPQLPVCNG